MGVPTVLRFPVDSLISDLSLTQQADWAKTPKIARCVQVLRRNERVLQKTGIQLPPHLFRLWYKAVRQAVKTIRKLAEEFEETEAEDIYEAYVDTLSDAAFTYEYGGWFMRPGVEEHLVKDIEGDFDAWWEEIDEFSDATLAYAKKKKVLEATALLVALYTFVHLIDEYISALGENFRLLDPETTCCPMLQKKAVKLIQQVLAVVCKSISA